MNCKTLGELITFKRLCKCLSQQELADQLGTSKAVVCKWEKDKAIPSRLYLEKLSHILSTPIEDLVVLIVRKKK